MLLEIVTLKLWFVGLYLAIGVVFALPFVWRGVNRIDPAAREGSLGFRLLILPGVVALWPLMAHRLRVGGPRPAIDSRHDIRTGGGGR